MKILTPLTSMTVLLLAVTWVLFHLYFSQPLRVRSHIRAILIVKIKITKHSFYAFLKEKMLSCFSSLWRSKFIFIASRAFIWSSTANVNLTLNTGICTRVQATSNLESKLFLPSNYWNPEGMKSSSPLLNN